VEGEKKKPSKLTDSVILLHINDHPHVANRVHDQLKATQWGVFKYPAYSLDLWPYDFHISGSFKKALMFTLHNDTSNATVHWFRQQLKELFANGLCWPVHQWVFCLNACGDFL
jgi:hypothetical protein